MPKRKFEATNTKSPSKGAATSSGVEKSAGKSRFGGGKGGKGGKFDKSKDQSSQPPKAIKTKQVKAKDFFGGGDVDGDMGFPSVDADLFMDEEEPVAAEASSSSSASSASSGGDTEDYDEKLAKEATEKAADKKKRSGGFQSMSKQSFS